MTLRPVLFTSVLVLLQGFAACGSDSADESSADPGAGAPNAGDGGMGSGGTSNQGGSGATGGSGAIGGTENGGSSGTSTDGGAGADDTGGGMNGGTAGNAGSAGRGGTPGTGGSAGSGAGTGGSATLPLKVSSDGRYLAGQNDVPFLIQGDAAWSLMVQLTREEAQAYLTDRRQRGFNLLMVNVLEHLFADDPPLNAYGVGPFTTPNDFATPNEEYFAHVDWVMEQAAANGLVILLCPAYLGYDGGEQGWYQVMVQNGATKLRNYGRYIGERYASFDNIVWLEGGDYTPPNINLTNAVAEGILELDSRHIHAAHWAPETSGADVTVSGWLDVDTTYTYEAVYEKSLEDYNRDDGRPHFFLEGRYEQESDGTPFRMRAQAYHALLTGARGQIYGHGSVWDFNSDWRSALGSPGAVSMTHVGTLFNSVAWTTLEPDEQNAILVGGLGTRGSHQYAVLAASSAGDLAIAYVPTVREVSIDPEPLVKPLGARWYDPTNGTYSAVAGAPFSGDAVIEVTPPGDNSRGDDDWVLVLETVR